MSRLRSVTLASVSLTVASVIGTGAVLAAGQAAPAGATPRPTSAGTRATGERGRGRPVHAGQRSPVEDKATCSAGAHTLSPPGSTLYPETGNGGYTSVHTGVDLVYDTATDTFLPGTQVVLTDRATQCLTSFSLDFERTSSGPKAGPYPGPDMAVDAVRVDGTPAAFTFVQPTYPGDPEGQDDPDPKAHEMSERDPVGGPSHNPLPPACTPELRSDQNPNSHDGRPCPANKLVVTPKSPIPDGATFVVTVDYQGRPGVHEDGDGELEGWWRTPDGGFVETEPVGTEDWMPLNDYPTAKPTYDFYDTVATGVVAVANGELVGETRQAPTAEFPAGSVIWHWQAAEPVASYLVQDSIGNYALREQSVDGRTFYQAQEETIPARLQQHNSKLMNEQPDIAAFESSFNGVPFPFPSDGIIVSSAKINSAEEMETMIAFGHDSFELDTLYHENMHQWWGDNVTEGGYAMTFFKEGMATVGQYLLPARKAEEAAGGPSTTGGQAAFNRVLVRLFDTTYAEPDGFWRQAPSDPSPATLWSNAATYARPAAAYLALRQILGPTDFTRALAQIQSVYGGGSITEAQLEAAFSHHLPDASAACNALLHQFFTQWFDTGYGGHDSAERPQLTGPGLDGPGFYGIDGCLAPAPSEPDTAPR